jgi:hypothetical protein
MANPYLRVGSNYRLNWQEFSADKAQIVYIVYKSGEAGIPEIIDYADNSYETSIGANANELNEHVLDYEIPEGMLGNDGYIGIRDATEEDQVDWYGPFDIIDGAAVSSMILPASTVVVIGRTRQFTVVYYAADGLVTTIHDPTVWSVDDGGTIDEDTGLFTAGAVVGGPHNVGVTAGALTAIPASILIIEEMISSNHSMTLGIGLFM